MKNCESIPYGWLPFAVFPYESTWSLIQKFALWNHCTADEIWRQFRTGHNARPRNKSLLLNCNYINLRNFFKILQITPEAARHAEIDYYLFTDEAEYLTANTLRYCLRCLTKGFHSPIHQLLFIKDCPFHQITLQEGCPVCSWPITAIFENVIIKTPLQCTKCNTRFVNPRILVNRFDSSERDRAFENVSNWLLARKAATEQSQFLSEWLDQSFSNALKRRRMRALPMIWAELTGIMPPFWHSERIGGILERIEARGVSSEVDYSYYKEKCDYITVVYGVSNGILNEHSECFDLIKRYLGWSPYTYNARECRICHLAAAFTMWRMYWEGVCRPYDLVSIKHIHHYCGLNYGFLPKQIVEVLARKIFESTFAEAVVLCKLLHRRKIMSFDFEYLKKRLCPYWVLKKGGAETNHMELFLWTEKLPQRSLKIQFTTEHLEKTRKQLSSIQPR